MRELVAYVLLRAKNSDSSRSPILSRLKCHVKSELTTPKKEQGSEDGRSESKAPSRKRSSDEVEEGRAKRALKGGDARTVNDETKAEHTTGTVKGETKAEPTTGTVKGETKAEPTTGTVKGETKAEPTTGTVKDETKEPTTGTVDETKARPCGSKDSDRKAPPAPKWKISGKCDENRIRMQLEAIVVSFHDNGVN